jgi:hypothetical protein
MLTIRVGHFCSETPCDRIEKRRTSDILGRSLQRWCSYILQDSPAESLTTSIK